jgi:hypothetical protein
MPHQYRKWVRVRKGVVGDGVNGEKIQFQCHCFYGLTTLKYKFFLDFEKKKDQLDKSK